MGRVALTEEDRPREGSLAIPNEDVLIQKAAQGDNRALRLLWKPTKEHSAAFRLVPDKRTPDIVQEVFLKAYQALPKFRATVVFHVDIQGLHERRSGPPKAQERTQVFSLDEPIMLGESPITRDMRMTETGKDLVENRSLGIAL